MVLSGVSGDASSDILGNVSGESCDSLSSQIAPLGLFAFGSDSDGTVTGSTAPNDGKPIWFNMLAHLHFLFLDHNGWPLQNCANKPAP